MELRAQYEAAEAREAERKAHSDEEGGSAEEEAEEGGDEEAATAVKKPKKKKAPTEPKPKRSRAAKVVRQRVVWVVYDNSHKPVQTYEYSRKPEAVAHAERLTAEKKSTHFVQPVREDIKD